MHFCFFIGWMVVHARRTSAGGEDADMGQFQAQLALTDWVQNSQQYGQQNRSTTTPGHSYVPFITRNGSTPDTDEQRLMKFLMRNYERNVRPVVNASEVVTIRMGLTLAQIFDMDEKNQVLVTNVWLDQEWYDIFLEWEPADYGHLKIIRLPCIKIWLPDIVLYNNAAEYTDGQMQANAMIHSDGRVFWPVPTKLQSSCKIDVTYFPFDQQTCNLKFGSWTYDGFQVTTASAPCVALTPASQVDIVKRNDFVDLSNYVVNGEWELLGISIVRNVVHYSCCNEPYPDVTFHIHIQRRTLYYLYIVILPCIMMSALTVLVFCLPPDSGEKVALGVTVLLAFSVFMLSVAEKLPETSEFVPLISIYLTIVMSLTSASVILTVLILNLHYREPNIRPVPSWLQTLAFRCIGPAVCLCLEAVDMPAEVYDTKRGIKTRHLRRGGFNIKMNLEEMTDELSHQLTALVQRNSSALLSSAAASPLPPTGSGQTPFMYEMRASLPSRQLSGQPLDRLLGADGDDTSPLLSARGFPAGRGAAAPLPPVLPGPLGRPAIDSDVTASSRRIDTDLLTALHQLVQRHDHDSTRMLVMAEWRKVGHVIDRLLFWLFLLSTIISTVLILVVLPQFQPTPKVAPQSTAKVG